MLAKILLLFCLTLIGCSATCLRDSDCMGNSACIQNRCLLIVSGDASVLGNPPSLTNGPDTQDDDDEGLPRDAGDGDAGN